MEYFTKRGLEEMDKRSVEAEQDTCPKMKRYHIYTEYRIYLVNDTAEAVIDKSGEPRIFKTRRAAEAFCKAFGYMYVEVKITYYR